MGDNRGLPVRYARFFRALGQRIRTHRTKRGLSHGDGEATRKLRAEHPHRLWRACLKDRGRETGLSESALAYVLETGRPTKVECLREQPIAPAIARVTRRQAATGCSGFSLRRASGFLPRRIPSP